MASKDPEKRLAIEAAKQRLALAKKWKKSAVDEVDSAKRKLSFAQSQLRGIENEEEEAESFLKRVEKQSEVIYVDSEDEDLPSREAKNNDGRKRQRTGSLSPQTGDSEQNANAPGFTSTSNAYTSQPRIASTARDSSAAAAAASRLPVASANNNTQNPNNSQHVSNIEVEGAGVAASIAESRPRRRTAGGRACIDALRIAVGKKVFDRKCCLSFHFGTKHPYILFAYYDHGGRTNEHSVFLKDDELKEVKYHIASEDENEDTDESMTMIAFRITPTSKNNFVKYSRSYNQEDTEDADKNGKYYISVEAQDIGDFQALLEQMRMHPTLKILCSDDSKIPLRDLSKYTQALEKDSQKDSL